MSSYFKRRKLTDGQRSWEHFPRILKNLEALRMDGFTFWVGKRPNRRGMTTMLGKAKGVAMTGPYMRWSQHPRLTWVEFGVARNEVDSGSVDENAFDAKYIESECVRLARLLWGPTLLMLATKRSDTGIEVRAIVLHIQFPAEATPDVILSTLSDENLRVVLQKLFPV